MPKRKPENSTIEVIVLEANRHLGEKYEKIRVKPVFARNVLLPQKKVVLATPMNINNYKQKMESAQKDIAKKATDMQDLFAKIQENDGLTFVVKVNEDGHLYAKIDENDIAKQIHEEYKIEVPSHLFKLKKKIAEEGTYKVAFLYKEMKADVQVIVQAEAPVKAKKEEVAVAEDVLEESAE